MIDNGMHRIQKLRQEHNQRAGARAAREPYNRLYVVLWNMPGYDKGQVGKLCAELEQMSPEQRREAIRQNFGQTALDKCLPALENLERMKL